ncbi:F-box SKIP23-like protein (DUF295) [Rhynchospora pubera]|uniref:F-box SKIP23-like protein (DUF295) n=1 Tax=Rhynchospora pubera TaxID=906938 RepID=A0AAV8FFG7_9POAL|nr:F-box SKIP23-like protein (DUF295) [Rhynchospora pubera]
MSEASMNWSDLPPELLHLISKKLYDIIEFMRFRAVCKQWRYATLLSDPPPQVPWLVDNAPLEVIGEEKMTVRSLFSDKTHTIHVPAKGPFWALSTGYLLAKKDEHSFSLINPLTSGKEIHLPILESNLHDFRPVCHDQRKDFVVVLEAKLENSRQPIVCFCRPGDETWKKTKLPVLREVFSCLYYNGSCLYLHDSFDNVLSVDAITGSILFFLPLGSINTSTSTFSFLYSALGPIVEFFGQVLIVRLNLNTDDHVISFEIYQLELRDDHPDQSKWVKTSNIGDDSMLFFDYRGNCLSAKTGDSSRLKGNSMYFFECYQDSSIDNDDESSNKYIPCRYDIADGTIEFLSSPLEGPFSWMMPNLFQLGTEN